VTLQINKWIIIAFLVGVIVLVFALVRGCQNEKKAASIVIDFKGRINKLTEDSISNTNQLAAYKDSMQFLDGQWSLSKNKELFLNEDLGKANDRITLLLRKHVPIKPSSDTSMTWAPNEFINECAECFHELKNGQQLVKKYKAEKDTQEVIYKSKLNVKDNRINHLEKANQEVTSSYMALIDITKDAGKPKGRMYLSWGVLWKNYVPWAAGGGLMYQNKRSVIFGASWYYNSQGHMVQSNVHFPLSLKRK
jgi:hypothetical protein